MIWKMLQDDKKIMGFQVDINFKNWLVVVDEESSCRFIPGAELVYKASSNVGIVAMAR